MEMKCTVTFYKQFSFQLVQWKPSAAIVGHITARKLPAIKRGGACGGGFKSRYLWHRNVCFLFIFEGVGTLTIYYCILEACLLAYFMLLEFSRFYDSYLWLRGKTWLGSVHLCLAEGDVNVVFSGVSALLLLSPVPWNAWGCAREGVARLQGWGHCSTLRIALRESVHLNLRLLTCNNEIQLKYLVSTHSLMIR